MTSDSDRNPEGEDRNGLRAEHESAGRPAASPVSSSSTTPSHLVEVTQADRDCFKAIFDLTDETLDPNGDDKRALEIIARHRLSAQRSCDAEVVKLREALAAINHEATVANDTIRLSRDWVEGSRRVKVVTAMHRIAKWAADAIEAGKHRND